MKKKISMILCSVLAAAVTLSGCTATQTASETPLQDASSQTESTPQESEAASEAASETASESKDIEGSLEAILEELQKEDSEYSDYKTFYPTATFTEKIDGDKIVISAQGDGEYDPNGSWEFVKDGDFITFHDADEDDYYGTMLFIYLSDAIAESLDMNPDLFVGYINGLSVLDMESEYFSAVKNDDGTVDFKVYMAKPFEMKELNEMYFTEDFLADAEAYDDTYKSNLNSLGKVGSVANGTKSSYKLIMMEYEKLDDLAVKSVKNLVSAHQPDGYEKFVENFNAFEDTETDEYTVKTNPTDEELGDYADQIIDGYVCAVITFGSDEAEYVEDMEEIGE